MTFFREIPAYAGFYSAYETSKRYFQNQVFPGQQLPVWATLTAGGTGGIAYWLASYPLGPFTTLLPSVVVRARSGRGLTMAGVLFRQTSSSRKSSFRPTRLRQGTSQKNSERSSPRTECASLFPSPPSPPSTFSVPVRHGELTSQLFLLVNLVPDRACSEA